MAIPLRELDMVILETLRNGPLDHEDLRDALNARRAARRAQRGPRRRIRPGRPGWPRIRFCSMSDPDIDNHGFVAVSGALMRLNLSELIREIEVAGTANLTLSGGGRQATKGEEFATAVATAEHETEGWELSVFALNGLIIALSIAVIALWQRLF